MRAAEVSREAPVAVPGEFLWGAPGWILPIVVAFLVVSALAVWNYSQRGIVTPVRIFATLLKIAAIALIAICLLQPMRSGTRPRPRANLLPILVDNSQSMQLKGMNQSDSRGSNMISLMREDSPWRIRLAQSFDARTYAFDARLEDLDTIDSLSLDGSVSLLTGSLTSLSKRLAGRPIAGAILFSDGNLTDAPTADFDWSSLGFPVYPVLPSEDDPVRDLRIAEVSARQTDFESAPVTLRVSVETTKMDPQEVFVQLRDEATSDLIEERSISLQATDESLDVTFRFRPEKPGMGFFRVVAFTEDDREKLQPASHRVGDSDDSTNDDLTSSDTREATLANNQRVVTVQRKTGPYRVLYLAGRPNWEFKFLRRALQEDAEVQLVGLLRIADKEPKFSFRDQGVTSTNPLFQGLGIDEEDAAQQYDQPVIIRLGVKESEELSEGFPTSPEELFAYHGIILDDIEPEFFTQDQLLLIRKFVAARGGGLLMLGGQESFAGKSFGDSPLGDLSPAYAARRLQNDETSSAARLSLTREGMLQPWVRLRETERAEQDRLKEMPSFLSINTVGDLKPGASKLAEVHTASGSTKPALLAQRFGKGRSAAIPIGDLWRWSMRRTEMTEDDLAQAWRQLTHWLVNEVPRRAEIEIQNSNDAGQANREGVAMVVTARDEGYLPLDNANVTLKIEPPDGDSFTLKAEPDQQTPGQYRSTYWAREPGAYRVTASIAAADGSIVGDAQSGWTAHTNATEFDQLQVNRELLTQIANETGGEIVAQDRLDAFVADLPNRKVPVSEIWVYPIWHRPWVMLLAIIFLCGEWGIRRLRGLA